MAGCGAGLEQRTRREHRDSDAGFHVEDSGPMQPAVLLLERHALDLADRPDGVEMAEEQDLIRTAAELGEQMIAAIRTREPRDARADRFKTPLQFGPAAIDSRFVRRRRFEADERCNRVEQPRLFTAAEIVEVYNRRHVV